MIKKIFCSIFFGFLVLFLFLFIFFLNFKLTLLNEVKFKQIVAESNASLTASSYIKNQVVKSDHIDVSDGDNLEKLDQVFGPDQIQNFLDKTIDQIFTAIKNPTDNNMTFIARYPEVDSSNSQLFFQRVVNLKDNRYFNLILNIDALLYIFAAGGLLCVGMLLLTLGWRDGAVWGTKALFVTGVFLLLLAIFLSTFAYRYYGSAATRLGFVADPTLQNGLVNILTNLASAFVSLYWIESVTSLILGAVLLFLAGINKKSEIKEIKGIL